MWTDDAGLTHGKFIFDDESAAWLRSIIDTALRPRRGGPRFVAADERASADELRKDTRSNEQLAHDLLLDVLKAGALADAASVFGARQAGIRLVQVVNRDDYLQRQLDGDRARGDAPVTRIIDGGDTLPSGIGDKHQCNTGAQRLIVDTSGNPLDVGREHRLFTAKQRVALAVRDGGCRWPACDRPASYCEAHHIDHWEADSGRTDIDRGLLLCSHHHLQLHNNGWKISRDGQGPFLLHPPPGAARSKFRRRSNSEGRALSSDRNEPRLASEPAAHTGTRLAVEPGLQGEAGVVVEPTLQGGAKPESASALHPASNPNSSPGSNPDLTDGAIELRPPLPLSYGWELASTPAKRFREAA
jgi:hypothetical protein